MVGQADQVMRVKQRLSEAYEASDKTYKSIAKAIGSNHGSVGKIIRGEFRFLNPTVRQICQILKIDPDNADVPTEQSAANAERIKVAALTLWDRSPSDAERIVAILSILADLRGGTSGGGG